MAHPADSGSKGPAVFASGRLSPEDADRFASMFRPSWELDDAPFTGPGTLSDGDLRALAGGGTHADVRAAAGNAAHAPNGTHAPAVPMPSSEPEDSVVIDRSITAQDLAPTAPPRPVAVKGNSTIMGMAAPTAPHAVPQAAAQAQGTQAATPYAQPPSQGTQAATPYVLAQAPVTHAQAPLAPPAAPPISRPPPPSQRPQAPAFNLPPPTAARAKFVSADLDVSYPRKSRAPLYVGLGLGGVAALGLVVWLAVGSGGGEKAAAPAPSDTHTVEDKLSSIPPPPPATTNARAAQAAAAPPTPVTAAPPATTAAPAPAPAPVPVTPVAALPTAAPLPAHAAAAAPRAYYGGGAPAARPAGKPKGQTIVRDVPF